MTISRQASRTEDPGTGRTPGTGNPRHADESPTRILPRALWLWFPPTLVAVEFLLHSYDKSLYKEWMISELGVVENLTVLFLVISIVIAVRLFRLRRPVRSRWFGPAMLLMALGCLLFAGEELSWGQHWIGFAPPDSLAMRNEQGEFNLHNDPLLEPLFDFWARNALSWFALIGGVIVPIARHRAGRRIPEFDSPGIGGWIFPTVIAVPAAAVASFVNIPKKILGWIDMDVPIFRIGMSETKELCLALMILLYALTLLHHLSRKTSV